LCDLTLIKIVVAHYGVTRCFLNIHSKGSTKYIYRVLKNFHDFILKNYYSSFKEISELQSSPYRNVSTDSLVADPLGSAEHTLGTTGLNDRHIVTYSDYNTDVPRLRATSVPAKTAIFKSNRKFNNL
jgi:hypothetical protein